MKHSELRTGNCFIYEATYHAIIKIAEDSCESYWIKGGDKTDIYPHRYDDQITPVILTTEILKNLGFYDKYKSVHTRWCLNGFCLDQKSDVNDDNESIPEEDVFYYDNTQVKYLHQLQNWYFLNKEEEFDLTGIIPKRPLKRNSRTKMAGVVSKEADNITKIAFMETDNTVRCIVTPIQKDSSLTTDKNNPGVNKPKADSNQNKAYIVLSDEERGKGYARPIRLSYVHVGKDIDLTKGIELTEEQEKRHAGCNYIAFIPDEDAESPIVGTFITSEDAKGGCRTSTKIGQIIAETYARDPKFYGATYCCGCNKHIAVEEFVWEGTEERVGS